MTVTFLYTRCPFLYTWWHGRSVKIHLPTATSDLPFEHACSTKTCYLLFYEKYYCTISHFQILQHVINEKSHNSVMPQTDYDIQHNDLDQTYSIY